MPDDSHRLPLGDPGESQHSLGQYQAELISLLQGVVEHGTGRAAALQGFAAGKGVVGGSLPAKIWKDFMEQASAPTVAGNNPVTLPASPTTVGQSQEAPGLSDQNAAAPAAEAQNPQCNVPACEEFYHSFRVSDCTYQPYWGPREYCER
jgi:penicillin-binding protein 1A